MALDRDEISSEIFEKIFLDYSVSLKVFLRGAKTKGTNFDKFRNTGYTIDEKNPIYISALTRAITGNSLIVRELGLAETGSLYIIVQDEDVPALKLAEKIYHNDLQYTPWNKALGNKFQEFPTDFFGYTKILIFRMNK